MGTETIADLHALEAEPHIVQSVPPIALQASLLGGGRMVRSMRPRPLCCMVCMPCRATAAVCSCCAQGCWQLLSSVATARTAGEVTTASQHLEGFRPSVQLHQTNEPLFTLRKWKLYDCTLCLWALCRSSVCTLHQSWLCSDSWGMKKQR